MTIPMQFTSGPLTPDMADRHPKGLSGLMNEVAELLPDQLIETAWTNCGLQLDKRVKSIPVTRKRAKVHNPADGREMVVYKLVATALFRPTRCIPDLQHHESPHTKDCPERG